MILPTEVIELVAYFIADDSTFFNLVKSFHLSQFYNHIFEPFYQLHYAPQASKYRSRRQDLWPILRITSETQEFEQRSLQAILKWFTVIEIHDATDIAWLSTTQIVKSNIHIHLESIPNAQAFDKFFPQLKSLRVTHFSCAFQGYHSTAQLQQLNQLTSLDIVWGKHFPTEQLFEYVEKSAITSLKLSKIRLSEESMQSLIRWLKSNPVVSLMMDDWDLETVKSGISSLYNSIFTSKTLQRWFIKSTSLISLEKQSFPTPLLPQAIELIDCKLTEADLSTLFAGMTNGHTRTLKIEDNNQTPRSPLRFSADHLAISNIQKLKFASSAMWNEECESLLCILQHSNVECLDLSDNCLTDDIATYFQSMQPSKLTDLILDGNSLTFDGIWNLNKILAEKMDHPWNLSLKRNKLMSCMTSYLGQLIQNLLKDVTIQVHSSDAFYDDVTIHGSGYAKVNQESTWTTCSLM